MSHYRFFKRITAVLVATAFAAILALGLASAALAQPSANPHVYPTTAQPFGKSYTAWSVAWWQWALQQPVAGHPFIDPFDCNNANNGQSGPVWFLALSAVQTSPAKRSCTIPADKAVLIALANVECSSLEGTPTADEQGACAKSTADQIDVSSLYCTIDGKAVTNLGAFRFPSPQFTFNAPTPWIFGNTGGTGTSMSDGYFVMIKPLSSGTHTVSCGGQFDFGFGVGNTYYLTVAE